MGRPTLPESERVGTPIRCLVTQSIADCLTYLAAGRYGINISETGAVPSDLIRLYVVRGLLQDGFSDLIREDATFKSLRNRGLI